MRTIKFRGRDVMTGNWAYGFYYPSKGHSIIRNENDCECIVFPESVGQFTGLTYKNGVGMFEDDIVRTPNGTDWGVIKYSEPFYGVTTSETYVCHYTKEFMEKCEIIGNIHENPELLK